MTTSEQREMPKRIRRERTKGWRKGANCVIVDRTSRYGNMFAVRPCDDRCSWRIDDPAGIAERSDRPNSFSSEVDARQYACELYALHTGPMGAYEFDDVEQIVKALKGKDLACPCPLPEPGEIDWCHAAHTLIPLANGGPDA
jgi:hypothetical protein